jgi:acyl dehydratase
MSLDLSAVGFETEPFFFEYDWKVPVLYALGVGAKREELDYLYEGRGPRVLPSFAVIPAYPALVPLVKRAGADMAKVVHGSQSVSVHGSLPASARLRTVARLSGIYDLKRLSQVTFSTQTFADSSSELLFETEWMLVIRDTGGFGGPRPPKSHQPKPLSTEKTGPLFTVEETISNEQALLYRLSGDLNPLHADPDFAREVGFDSGPILHGLATYGFATRAAMLGTPELKSEKARVSGIHLAFKKPVWPGEVLRTVGEYGEDQTVLLTCYAGGRDEPVAGGFVSYR